MNQSYSLDTTPKQQEAVRLIANNRSTLLEGGSRSGKTFVALWVTWLRAKMYPGTRHLVVRLHFNHAKQSICYDTVPALLEASGLGRETRLNKTDWFYELDNGSTIWVGGLDDKDRTEKILGNEYATIFENEASQLSYDSHETLMTRLNPPNGVPARNIIDYNPPHIRHWGYSIFHKREFPDGRQVPDSDYARLLMNPTDNPYLSEDYIESLSMLSEAKRKRFLSGEYMLDGGSLWKREWIRYDTTHHDYDRIVVGVDPAGSSTGDEVGVIVVGRYGDKYTVLDDFTLNGTPAQWAAAVSRAYETYKADAIVAEKNYGGDMVDYTIRSHARSARVKMVSATRGKVVRAEPISAMYEQGNVFHRQPFPEMEDEMCMYEPGESDSPNRMDALVWALTELSNRGGTPSAVSIPGL